MLERFTWYRQAAFRWSDGEMTVYIDPWGTPEDADPADLILITHAHFDHFQPDEIARLSRPGTRLVAPHDVAAELSGDVTPVAPDETHDVGGVKLATVPAYNTNEERLDKHPRSCNWVGYVLELGGHSYYHAGDTDHAPELDGTWLVTSYLADEEMTVPDHRAEAYMSIDGDRVSGTMGLNRFMGQMQDGLPGQNLAVTRMSGPPELMRQEDILLGHLMGTDTIEVVEEGMTMSREGLTLVELRRRGTESPEPSS